MSYVLQAVDGDEYFHDTDYEILGNVHMYGVISGCTLTYDASDMTVDLAAGEILHNGTKVTVAGSTNAYTLVSDASNERWAALCISDAGAAVLVSGDAAADSDTEPTKPEIGDRVLVGMVKIQAAQTVAANCEFKLDKRVITHGDGDTLLAKDADETVNNSATVQDDDDLFCDVEASSTYVVEGVLLVSSASTSPSVDIKWTLPTGASGRGAIHAGTSTSSSVIAQFTDITSETNQTALTISGVRLVPYWAVITIGATAGTAQMQWAQNTATSEDTKLLKGSYLRVRKVA